MTVLSQITHWISLCLLDICSHIYDPAINKQCAFEPCYNDVAPRAKIALLHTVFIITVSIEQQAAMTA